MSTVEAIVPSEDSLNLETSEILLQRIIVATDFSDCSTRALKEAIAIGREFHAEILLVHAASPAIYGITADPIPAASLEAELDGARAQMVAFIHAEPDLRELTHREFVELAGAADLVRRVAREYGADLVVAGSHSFGGLERLALGSVAESILTVVPCPVMIVGPSCRYASHPFRSILLATDLETTGLRAAQFATSLAERFHTKLTLLHVLEKHPKRSAVQPELAEDNARLELARLLPSDLPTYTSATLRIEQGKPGELVPAIAASLCASLIVTGFGDRSSFSDHAPWSTLSQIIRDAPCPVLSVRRHFI
ncbi:MAG: universal stress protein [Acidobacteriota bacterium]